MKLNRFDIIVPYRPVQSQDPCFYTKKKHQFQLDESVQTTQLEKRLRLIIYISLATLLMAGNSKIHVATMSSTLVILLELVVAAQQHSLLVVVLGYCSDALVRDVTSLGRRHRHVLRVLRVEARHPHTSLTLGTASYREDQFTYAFVSR